MSDNWIRIVPSDPGHVPTADRAQALMSLVAGMMPSADEVTIEASDEIVFVDAGVNQGSALCPQCGAELASEWWATAMAESYDRSAFADRRVVTPCCGANSDLNELDYGDWPIAFARWWVDCMNPNLGRLDEIQVRSLVAALDHPITVVYQHL